jgi:hypothetical protein
MGQINVREYKRGNHKWKIQRIWQHRVHKTQDKSTLENTKGAITNGQSRESDNIGYTRHKTNICCQILWIFHLWLSLLYSLTFICPMSCVLYVVSFSGLSICDCPFGILWCLFVPCLVYSMLLVSLDCPFVIAPLVFSDVYLSCVLCTLCCQFLWIVHLWLPLWYSLTFICLVYFVPYVVSFSGLYIFDCPFDILWRLFVLCLVKGQSQIDNPENLTT